MFLLTIGSAIMYMFATDAFEVAEKKPAGIYYRHGVDTRMATQSFMNEPLETVSPLSEQKFKNIAHQTYDYSCGSAALTTLLNGYLGRQFTEKQIMDGMLKFGEYDKIVQRRGFSLLDMKRLVIALGHNANGFKGSLEELKKAEHPAIVAIHYMNFKHFVIVKNIKMVVFLWQTQRWVILHLLKLSLKKYGSRKTEKVIYLLSFLVICIQKKICWH